MMLSVSTEREHLLRDRFAQLLGTVRHHRRLSQEEVAHLAGIDVGTYRRLEARPRAGNRCASPRFDTVLKLVIALKIDINEMAVVLDDLPADK